jgi:hypothetical protein
MSLILVIYLEKIVKCFSQLYTICPLVLDSLLCYGNAPPVEQASIIYKYIKLLYLYQN